MLSLLSIILPLLPCLQSSCTRRMSGTCLRTFRSAKLSISLPVTNVATVTNRLNSSSSPPFFASKGWPSPDIFNFNRRYFRLHTQFSYILDIKIGVGSIQEEIKSRLEWEKVCYYSVQNLLSSSLLSKKLNIKKYWTIILPVVLYGCETWSLTLR